MNEIRWIFTAAAIPSTFTATTIPCAGEFRQCKQKNMNIKLDEKKIILKLNVLYLTYIKSRLTLRNCLQTMFTFSWMNFCLNTPPCNVTRTGYLMNVKDVIGLTNGMQYKSQTVRCKVTQKSMINNEITAQILTNMYFKKNRQNFPASLFFPHCMAKFTNKILPME